MFNKKLMSLGIAVVFALSSLTTTVFAADYNKLTTGTNVAVKSAKPGKGNGNGQIKSINKIYKFNDCNDVNVSWALNSIEKLAAKGIIGGVGLGQFAPQKKVTELEALTMVLRLTGDNDYAESKNNQVHPSYHGTISPWAMGYIFVAIEKGILLPEELGSFQPNTPAKRHEIAKYVIRAMGKTDEALKHMDEDLTFKDSSAVPEESIGYVYLINKLNIMNGNDGNKFEPMEPVTRAQIAAILDRAEGNFNLPDTDKRKYNTVFVSADENDNEITVKVKGTAVTYDYLDNTQVYKNGAFADIEDLVKGDVLQLTLNSDKEVIFIEVVKNAEDDAEDDESVVEGEIYDLVASSKTIKVEKSNGTKVSYTVPSSAEIIVNDNDDADFSDLEEGMTVKLNITDDKVTKVTAEDAEENEEDEVTFEEVNYDDLSSRLKDQVDYLKLNKNYKAYEYGNYIYLIATMGKKTSDDYKIEIDKISKSEKNDDYTITAEVDIDTPSSDSGSDKVYPCSVVRFKYFDDIKAVKFVDEDSDELAETKVVELDEATSVKGTITYISTSSRTIKVEKSTGSTVTLTIPSDAEITVNNDENESFSDLEKGMKVEVEIIDNNVTKIIAEDVDTEVEGILTGISINTEKKITLKVGSKYNTYTVNSDVKVIIDDKTASFEDLRVNDELTLRFTNNLLLEIEKE